MHVSNLTKPILSHFFGTVLFVLALGTLADETCGEAFYIDSILGADPNSGLSESEAWETLARANSQIFNPGDRLLFRSGASWTGTLEVRGSGTSQAPITVDRYGEGPLPLIEGDGAQAAIAIENEEYWEIRNLEITNTLLNNEDHKIFGVYVKAVNFGICDHIHLRDLVIHDVDGTLSDRENGGIFLEALGGEVPTRFNDILIEGCYLYDCDRSGFGNQASPRSRSATDDMEWNPSTNIVIRDNVFQRIGGNGLVVRAATAPIVERNTFIQCSWKTTGNANYPFNCDNALFQFNESFLTKWEPGTPDASGFDSDYRCKNTIIQYNYSHDNDRGFCLITNQDGSTRFNDGTIVRYNISENDGRVGGGNGQVFRVSGTPTNTVIHNNTIYIGAGLSTRPVWHKSWPSGAWPDGTKYYNNIFYNLGSGDYDFESSTNNLFDSNIFFGNHPPNEPEDSNKITDDPKLRNPGSGGNGFGALDRYELLPGSPAIDSGSTLVNHAMRDYWGNSVPFNGLVDRGAHEYHRNVSWFRLLGKDADAGHKD